VRAQTCPHITPAIAQSLTILIVFIPATLSGLPTKHKKKTPRAELVETTVGTEPDPPEISNMGDIYA
jgi:hypothetical protein